MVGLLFAFMPVLSHQPGQELDRADVFRLLIKCAATHVAVALGFSIARVAQ